MRKFLANNLLILCIVAAGLLAFFVPAPGKAMNAWGLISPSLFVVFLCQGASIDARALLRSERKGLTLAWGAFVALVCGPALGWAAMAALHWEPDFRVGFIMMCCMGPTLVSGVVIATQAGGEREAALGLTVALNLASVFAIPLALKLTLGADVELKQAPLLIKLLTVVLIPAMVGQAARMKWPSLAGRFGGLLKYTPILLLGFSVYLGMAAQSKSMHELQLVQALGLLVPALAVHGVLLVGGYAGARRVFGLTRARSTALAIVCSQKTLPVVIAVWSSAFATTHPLALIPAMIFHLGQIYTDGTLARWWGRRAN